MKAYKSLHSHKYFSAGFVLKIGTKIVSGFYVIVGKVTLQVCLFTSVFDTHFTFFRYNTHKRPILKHLMFDVLLQKMVQF